MRSPVEHSAVACPQCGAEMPADDRFGSWCAACDWNVAPEKPEAAGPLERIRRAAARRHGERLLAEVTGGGTLLPRRDPAALAARAIALAVHGATVALLVTGILCLVLGWGSALPAVGAFCLGTAWVLRPRFGRLPAGEPVLDRAAAPELFALIDEVAAVAGTTGVDSVVVTSDVNASVSTYGIRGRRVLTLGLGLWEIMPPQQRVALLGHELGHYSNGDVRHGAIVSGALRSLGTWCYVTRPTARPSGMEIAVNALCLLPYWTFYGLLALLDALTLRATQRAEYLADAVAAEAGSTAAAVGVMDRLLVADSAVTLLLREANAAQLVGTVAREGTEERWRGLWTRLAASMDAIPEREYERQRRAGVLRGHSVDSTHPPTHLRRACLLARSAVAAQVLPNPLRQAAVDAELAGARERLARRIVRGG